MNSIAGVKVCTDSKNINFIDPSYKDLVIKATFWKNYNHTGRRFRSGVAFPTVIIRKGDLMGVTYVKMCPDA